MTVGDAEGDGLVLGYEFEKYGSLTNDQIPYDGQAITVWTVHTVGTLRTYMYFGSSPRVPRGTVVTVDGRSFTTDTESDDGTFYGDQMELSHGRVARRPDLAGKARTSP